MILIIFSACSNNDLIANPDDCGSYFLCSNQRHVLMPCPNGLQWSSERKVRDFFLFFLFLNNLLDNFITRVSIYLFKKKRYAIGQNVQIADICDYK